MGNGRDEQRTGTFYFTPCLVSWANPSHRKEQDTGPPQEDLRAKFYEHYRKEADEYDKEFMKKYEEDLDTTLIFVCYPHRFNRHTYIDLCHRLVCSPPSLPPSSSRSTLSSSLIRTKRPPPSSVSSSTRWITPPSATTFLPSHSLGLVPHARSSRSRQFCSPVLPLHSSLPSWRCLASSG